MSIFKIACVIVTYNRKELLKRCLDAVASQSYKPHTVFITDNASTDGTLDSVKEWGYYECVKEGIQFKYILNSKNEGGAGGFYLGMKTAFESEDYDGIWVMDDDGEPDVNCLFELTNYLGSYDYISPLVLSEEDHFTCSFYESETIETLSSLAENGVVNDKASPFNGILYSSKLIKAIGFPKKEMFIWGDEVNYHIRAKKEKFIPVTIVKAVHYHPMNRLKMIKGVLGSHLVVINQDWKWFCFCRNLSYNITIENGKVIGLYRIFLHTFKYSVHFLYIRNVTFLTLMIKAFYKGFVGDFSGLETIMNK